MLIVGNHHLLANILFLIRVAFELDIEVVEDI